MKEQPSPTIILDGQLQDYHSSPVLSFDCKIQASGYPDNEALFDTAFCYVEVIVDEFIQSGQFWNKTAADVLDRLLYLNERNKYEIELEHKSGETSATYLKVSIHHLRALSERQLRAMEATGWEESKMYQMARYFHSLVEQAVVGYEELQNFTDYIVPLIYLTDEIEDDTGVPF